MHPAARAARLDRLANARANVLAEIRTVAAERAAWLAAWRADHAGGERSFEDEALETVPAQAARKGIRLAGR